MSNRRQIETAAQNIARSAKALKPTGSCFCVLMWGPDESGQQWRTYVHDVAPVAGPETRASSRRTLAAELRVMADLIESRADLPPGVSGHG